MLKFDNGIEIDYVNMGYFIGYSGWTHPEITVETYEIIFVTEGDVYIEEGEKQYHLRAGDLLCLRPGIVHRGYAKGEIPCFYWLHFYAKNYDKVGVYTHHSSSIFNRALFFRQLNHLSQSRENRRVVECKFAAYLMELANMGEGKNKLFGDVCEYIRVHITDNMRARDIADLFGYSSDYLSRVFNANCGVSLKTYIMSKRNDYIKHLLLSTNMTVREIAEVMSFDSDNALIKFFRYANGTTPTLFRNSYYLSHTNIR